MTKLHIDIDGLGSRCDLSTPCIPLVDLIKQIEQTEELPANLCPDCKESVIAYLKNKEDSITVLADTNVQSSQKRHYYKAAKRCSKMIGVLNNEH